MIRRCLLLVLCLCVKQLLADDGPLLAVYPGPAESYRSDRYSAQVVHGGQTVDAFVMSSHNAWREVPGKNGKNWELDKMSKENHWLALASADEVTVLVTCLKGAAQSVQVLPAAGATATTRPDGRAEIAVKPAPTGANYYWVCINGKDGEQFPFFLFVDPPEKDIPSAKDPKVHYFKPGVHDIGPQFKVGEGETVYIAGGALVRGTIAGKGKNIRICGRGILSGEDMQLSWIQMKRAENEGRKDRPDPKGFVPGQDWLPMIWLQQADGARIDGPVIIDAPSWNVTMSLGGGAPDSTVRNIKVLSWNYSTDGVSPGARNTVENVFLKVNDDDFTLFQSDLTIRNLVIWKQMNASVFQLGYGNKGNNKNMHIQDVEIVRDETDVQASARGILSLAASKGAQVRDLRIERMTVHGNTLNLLAIDNLDVDTPWSAKVADVKLGPIEVALKDVAITGVERGAYYLVPFPDRKNQPMRSRLRTEKDGSISATFENVSIHGKKLTDANDFPNGLEVQGDVHLSFK